MDNSSLIAEISSYYKAHIDSEKISRKRKNRTKECLDEFLQITAKSIDENYENSDDIKPYILEIFAQHIVLTSICVFHDELDEYYDEILQKIAYAVYETVFLLWEQEPDGDVFEKRLAQIINKEYKKIVKEIGHNCVSLIKESDIKRNSAYFWQLIFVKYTSDNNRVFYPNFLSDGYFITSEKQFVDYQKYGNKFFIICFFVLIFMAKFRLLKALFYFNFLSIQTFGLIVAILLIINTIYNFISQKLIFKNCIKTSEKFWQNNFKTVNFLKTLTKQVVFAIFITVILVTIGVNSKEAYIGIPLTIASFLGFLFYLDKKGKNIQSFVIEQEKDAIKSFIIKELDNIKMLPNSNNIIKNLETPLNDYVDYMYKVENLDYIIITRKIAFFIRHFVKFNNKLYSLNIEQTKHIEIIQERFLQHFDFV